MTDAKQANLPPISHNWVDGRGVPTIQFGQFMAAIDANVVGPLVSAANDADAAKAKVPINALYEASGVVRIRKV